MDTNNREAPASFPADLDELIAHARRLRREADALSTVADELRAKADAAITAAEEARRKNAQGR